MHYINCATGRIEALADLAKTIRLLELQLSIEAVAVYLPGERNITADALSRLHARVHLRDAHPDRALRKKLFQQLHVQFGPFIIDGMADDDGNNAQCTRYFSPSFSFFEQPPTDELVWLFPPDDVLPLLLKFLDTKRKENVLYRAVLLVPETSEAPWFHYLQYYHRLARYRRGSDLFRELNAEGEWVKLRACASPYIVLRTAH